MRIADKENIANVLLAIKYHFIMNTVCVCNDEYIAKCGRFCSGGGGGNVCGSGDGAARSVGSIKQRNKAGKSAISPETKSHRPETKRARRDKRIDGM